jgi:hypothetical protein
MHVSRSSGPSSLLGLCPITIIFCRSSPFGEGKQMNDSAGVEPAPCTTCWYAPRVCQPFELTYHQMHISTVCHLQPSIQHSSLFGPFWTDLYAMWIVSSGPDRYQSAGSSTACTPTFKNRKHKCQNLESNANESSASECVNRSTAELTVPDSNSIDRM